ncbi:hypothetical protein [Myxococcus qinghaiensis]|uniref:hypothetical protein n=1 Tax=Myxococcus qinghaiensis TaxID=2906758 RepID=UPI0020A73351|nr:hypothetical protein [Myxococcus qinghaiensis]MCP3167807.1 hypothetical protein [Myxococcus qinghaiensis]
MSRNESRAWVRRWVLAGLLLGTLGCGGRNARPGDSADVAGKGPVQQYYCPDLGLIGQTAVKVEGHKDVNHCVDPGGTITFDSKCETVTYVLFAGEKIFDLSQAQPKCLTLADECQKKMGALGTITLEKEQSCQLTLAPGVLSGQIKFVGNMGGTGCASQGSAARIPPMDVIIGKLEVATSTNEEEDARGPR